MVSQSVMKSYHFAATFFLLLVLLAGPCESSSGGQDQSDFLADFGRIGNSLSPWAHPQRIERPPFYAVQFFPLTRKSMGGVEIDQSCRVIDILDRPIKGLYAVGELTGLAGVNGKASLEGTFLGSSIITGRVAGRAVVAELAAQSK